jgi:alkanesulfonate monooxygenase SsuD/methylene tetrahydromethanopterin reductase-like flavin-dependent oxidoreductase (luciferase family)
VGLEAFTHKSEVLRAHCDAIGRDFDDIARTHAPDCRLFDTEADLERWLDDPAGGDLWGDDDPAGYVQDNLIGTDAQVAGKVQAFLDAGCSEFVLWFRDYPDTESMERFMAAVVPRLHLRA